MERWVGNPASVREPVVSAAVVVFQETDVIRVPVSCVAHVPCEREGAWNSHGIGLASHEHLARHGS